MSNPHVWIYGRHPVYETLLANRRHFFQLQVAQGVQEKGVIADILTLCVKRKIKVHRVPREKLDEAVPGNQGVVLETGDYPYRSIQEILNFAAARGEAPFLLLLDSLQDPQNLGTLLRTAEAVGVHGVILPNRRTVTVTAAVVNASSGATEHLLIAQDNLAQAIDFLKSKDIWIVGLEYGPEAEPPDRVRLDGALGIVVGSEGEGLRRLVRDKCDLLLSLPMRGRIGSLNAATAGSVALYLGWQARGFG